MVEWSYRLLSERARLVFDRASAFRGGFDSEASRAVLVGGTVDFNDVPSALDELVRTSMMVASRHGDHVRYEMLETLRADGAEQLVRSGEASAVQYRHGAYYASLVTRLNDDWGSLAEADARATFTLEWPNLRAAFHRCATTGVSEAITILTAARLAITSPHASEHAAWARSLVDAGPPLAVPIAFGWTAFHTYYGHGDYQKAIHLGTTGLEIADAAEGPDVSMCLSAILFAAAWLGDQATAADTSARVERIVETVDDVFVRSIAYAALIEYAFLSDLAAVAPQVARYERWAASTSAPSIMAGSFAVGRANMWATDPANSEAAIASYTKGLLLARSVGDVGRETLNLMGIAIAHLTLDTADAPTITTEALTGLLAVGAGGAIRLLVSTLADWFARNDQTEAAEVLRRFVSVGDLARSDRRTIEQRRSKSHRTIPIMPDMEDIVSYAMDQLQQPHRSP